MKIASSTKSSASFRRDFRYISIHLEYLEYNNNNNADGGGRAFSVTEIGRTAVFPIQRHAEHTQSVLLLDKEPITRPIKGDKTGALASSSRLISGVSADKNIHKNMRITDERRETALYLQLSSKRLLNLFDPHFNRTWSFA